jgi:hypothetical protein
MPASRATEEGQATVEFALVLPLVVLAASFVVGTGVAVRDQIALVRAAGVAARAASVAGGDEAAARGAVGRVLDLPRVRTTVTVDGDFVRVDLRHDWRPPAWPLPWSPRTMTASATVHLEDLG